ncbi:undecaprenyl-diphosphate phosphatase [soil metagenome]
MSWWESLIMGVIQGLTEFFPVSSSGHLVMAGRLLDLQLPGIVFEVAVHVATLVSVVIVYRQKVWSLLRGLAGKGEQSSWPYMGKLLLASIPAGVMGVLFKDWFEARFDDPRFAGTMILVTGSFVWSTRWARGQHRIGPLELLPIAFAAVVSLLAGTIVPFLAVLGVEALIMGVARWTAKREVVAEPTTSGALLMGVAQACAILPGISRSGSTVVTALWRRIDPVAAAEFSFLMSIPAILGAALLNVPDAMRTDLGMSFYALAVGAIAAGVSGVVAIRFFVVLLKRQNFHAFAWYCWAAGALFLVLVGRTV